MVRAHCIPDPTQQEVARVVVDRDGVRLLDLASGEAHSVSVDRRVDERIRAVLTQVNLGVAER